MGRIEAFATKTQEIQKDLEEWARRENITGPGEQICFSMHIKSFPAVTVEIPEEINDLEVGEVFTRAKCLPLGLTAWRIERIRWLERCRDVKTVRSLIAYCISELANPKEHQHRATIQKDFEAVKKVLSSLGVQI